MRAEAASNVAASDTSTADMAASTGWCRVPRPMKSRYALVVTWNPGGTWNPARARRASEAPLPPTTPGAAPGSSRAITSGACSSTRCLLLLCLVVEPPGHHLHVEGHSLEGYG